MSETHTVHFDEFSSLSFVDPSKLSPSYSNSLNLRVDPMSFHVLMGGGGGGGGWEWGVMILTSPHPPNVTDQVSVNNYDIFKCEQLREKHTRVKRKRHTFKCNSCLHILWCGLTMWRNSKVNEFVRLTRLVVVD